MSHQAVLVSCRESALLRREVRCARPPLLLEKICWLVVIMGESRASGRGLGLEPRANLVVVKKDLLGN